MRGRNSSFQNLEDAKATLNLEFSFRSFADNCLMFCLEMLRVCFSLGGEKKLGQDKGETG